MDTVYSQPFDHLTSNCLDNDRKLSDRRSNTGRAAFKKRDPVSQDNSFDGMGQSQGSAEYIDPGEVEPRQPIYQKQISGGGRKMGFYGNRARGHIDEDSNDYCYADPDQVTRASDNERFPYSEGYMYLDQGQQAKMKPFTKDLLYLESGYQPDSEVLYNDDYSQPSDRVSVSSSHLSSSGHHHYVEPYKATSSSRSDETSTSIYAFAKEVDTTVKQPVDIGDPNLYNHISSGQTTNRSSDEQSEAYDHISSWASKPAINKSNISTQLSRPANEKDQDSDNMDDVFIKRQQHHGEAGNYEEPWDSEEGQKKLSSLMEKAERTDNRRQSSDSTPKPKPPVPAVRKSKLPIKENIVKSPLQSPMDYEYQDSWASEANQRKFSDRLDGSDRKSPSRTPPAVSPVRRNLIQNYEDAWDTSEKQKELEEKIYQAHKKKVSLDQVTPIDRGRNSADVERSRAPQCTPPPISPVHTRNPVWNEKEKYTRSDSCRSLGALAEPVNPNIPLEDQVFYHGSIKRSEAERILVLFKEGSYLVRRSETCNRDFSLTLKGWNGIPMHMKINCRPDGLYVLGENSAPFETIPAMVAYYTQHELPVVNAERICLLYPIPS